VLDWKLKTISFLICALHKPNTVAVSEYTNQSLRESLGLKLAAFSTNDAADSELTQAAVALTVIFDGGEPGLIVTRRTPRLNAHSGQWALPGGRVDPGETSTDAAFRELQEEVGINLQREQMLGRLDTYITRSGYAIAPIVIWSDLTPADLTPSPDEVQSVHTFSFEELLREDSPNLEQIPESDRDVLSMNYLDDVIYAPTAAMLYQFREVCLLGNETRVAHFDQPVFAWK
jgi:8-oxo-dGTP pyrophosphatase MutT (NUDIX family)